MVDWVVLSLCLVAFGAAAYTDLRIRTIPEWTHLVLLAAGLLHMVATGVYLDSLLGLIGLGGCTLLLGVLNGGMGGGDIKLIATSGLVFGLSLGFWGLLLSLFFSLAYALGVFLFEKRKIASVAYAPFHGAGFIFALILNGGF